MTKAAFFGPTEQIERVYAQGRREILESRADCYPHLVTQDNFERHAPQLGDLEVIFSTWGMPALSRFKSRNCPICERYFTRRAACSVSRALFWSAASAW